MSILKKGRRGVSGLAGLILNMGVAHADAALP